MASTSLAQAQAEILGRCQALAAEVAPVSAAAGRVLARELTASIDLPPFANSAMDGFALIAADTAAASEEAPATLKLIGESRAGAPMAESIAPGSAAYISTGAVMPEGADCVVRVEDSRVEQDHLLIARPVDAMHDVRPAGDDVHAGAAILPAGHPLGAGELALAHAVGVQSLEVIRRPRVSIVATGDELVAAGQSLNPGQIYDSNSPMLRQLVTDSGGEVHHLAVRTPDSHDAVGNAIDAALAGADVLVLCGGVSVGQHDHVKAALGEAGAQEIFWQVALRPGHPTWFGQLERSDGGQTLIFGLPGNPVSAWVTFNLFVAPALRHLQGDLREPLTLRARYSGEALRKKRGFAQVLRCKLQGEGSELRATLTGANQRSHALSSLVGAEALMLLPEECELVEDGDFSCVQPLGQYTWSDK